eukprot:1161223-Pelagomonas_calceolata.AAC.9
MMLATLLRRIRCTPSMAKGCFELAAALAAAAPSRVTKDQMQVLWESAPGQHSGSGGTGAEAMPHLMQHKGWGGGIHRRAASSWQPCQSGSSQLGDQGPDASAVGPTPVGCSGVGGLEGKCVFGEDLNDTREVRWNMAVLQIRQHKSGEGRWKSWVGAAVRWLQHHDLQPLVVWPRASIEAWQRCVRGAGLVRWRHSSAWKLLYSREHRAR